MKYGSLIGWVCHLLGDLTWFGFLIMWMRPLEKWLISVVHGKWWSDHLNVASLSAGMQRRSLSHPWVLAGITSDMIMFKGKAEWKRRRDRQGITSEESLSMTYWLPRQSVKRPISSACPSLPVVPSPSVSHTTFSEGFEQLVAFSKDWQEII